MLAAVPSDASDPVDIYDRYITALATHEQAMSFAHDECAGTRHDVRNRGANTADDLFPCDSTTEPWFEDVAVALNFINDALRVRDDKT